MPVPAIKICGISTRDALEAALRFDADYVGLVFFPKSPRNVGIEEAASLAALVRAKAKVVGLFVDPEGDLIEAVRRTVHLDVIQLHGSEHPALVSRIGTQSGLEVWKAVGVRTSADIADTRKYLGAAQRILYDAKPPEGAELPGGSGLTIDWSLIKHAHHSLPWGLAGGLTAGNVRGAIRTTGAPLVDASSGLESAPGVKNPAKIRSFIEAARSA